MDSRVRHGSNSLLSSCSPSQQPKASVPIFVLPKEFLAHNDEHMLSFLSLKQSLKIKWKQNPLRILLLFQTIISELVQGMV